MLTWSRAFEQLITDMNPSSSIKLDTIWADEKYLIVLLLSPIQAGFCSVISVSSPYITLKINTCSSISSVPANCSQNSKPLLDVRSVLLSLRDLCAKGLSCLKYTLSICMAAAFHSFVFSCILLSPLSFHWDSSAVPHYGLSLLLSQPALCQSHHPAFYYLYFS